MKQENTTESRLQNLRRKIDLLWIMNVNDEETLAEKELITKGYNLKSDVLKVGHHGSNTSSSVNFLKSVSPKYAIVSVGTNNIYHLPDSDIISRLLSFNIKTYRTDLNGTIISNTDGNKITFNTEK